jgi:ABC-type spermidine/putrescine transport system permease subunit II
VVIPVVATLPGFDPNQARAGASLGTSPTVVLFRIVLPLILPGVVSGALFAFVNSFDEVVVALFLTGPGERALPRQMFNGIGENISPVIAAAASLLIPPLGAPVDRARAAASAQRAITRNQGLTSLACASLPALGALPRAR